MLTIHTSEEFDEVLRKYLVNVLNIPQLWEEKKTLKQKDAQRKKLHDKGKNKKRAGKIKILLNHENILCLLKY